MLKEVHLFERPDPRVAGSWCREGVAHDHKACGRLWNSSDPRDVAEAAQWADNRADSRSELRPVSGQPKASAAEPCDEHCDPACVHHTASVGWDLSYGSRINFHPRDTTDSRLVVSLQLSDDAVANGMVYREVRPDQVAAFGQQLRDLVDNEEAERDLLAAFARWLDSNGQLTAAPAGGTNDLDDLASHFLADRREARLA